MTESLQVKPEVQSVAFNLLGGNVLQVRKITSGRDSTSYEIKSTSGDYILRTAGSRGNYDVEHHILRLLKEKGVKAPVPISENVDTKKYPFEFSLEEELPGVSLSDIRRETWPQIIKEVGEQMRIVYDLEFPGFGPIDATYFRRSGRIRGSRDSWFEYLLESYNRKTQKVKEKYKSDQKDNFIGSPLSRDQIEKLTEVVNNIDLVKKRVSSSRQLFDIKQGSLIHSDISPQHIYVTEDKLSGILDFNDIKIGDPLYDVAIFSVGTKGDYYNDLASEAGVDFDESRFRLYRLMISMGKLDIRYVKQSYLHENPRILDIAIEEINK